MTAKRFTRKEFAIYEKGNPICMTLRDVDVRLNELWEENEQLKKQMERLYNYFEDWFEDTMSPNAFSEMWDNVKESKKWEKKWYE